MFRRWQVVLYCVPNYFNNSRKRKELSFYVTPSNPELRKKWLFKISIKKHYCFVLTSYLFSAIGNNVPTIVPKNIKLEIPNPRNSRNRRGGSHRIDFPLVVILMKTQKLIDRAEPTQEEKIAMEIGRLKEALRKVKFP